MLLLQFLQSVFLNYNSRTCTAPVNIITSMQHELLIFRSVITDFFVQMHIPQIPYSQSSLSILSLSFTFLLRSCNNNPSYSQLYSLCITTVSPLSLYLMFYFSCFLFFFFFTFCLPLLFHFINYSLLFRLFDLFLFESFSCSINIPYCVDFTVFA